MENIEFQKAKPKEVNLLDKFYMDLALDEGKIQFTKKEFDELKRELKKRKKQRRKNFLKALKGNNYFCYFVISNNKIIGFVSASLTKRKGEARLENVYIKPEFRKKGIAKKACKFILNLLKKKDVKKVESGIYIKNKPSMVLHKSLGFEPLVLRVRKEL